MDQIGYRINENLRGVSKAAMCKVSEASNLKNGALIKNDSMARQMKDDNDYVKLKPSKKRDRLGKSQDHMRISNNIPGRQIGNNFVDTQPVTFKFSRRLLRRKHVRKEMIRMKQSNQAKKVLSASNPRCIDEYKLARLNTRDETEHATIQELF